MLSYKTICEILETAMMKYASDNGGKIGINRKDVVRIVKEHQGDHIDVNNIMCECLFRLSENQRIRCMSL